MPAEPVVRALLGRAVRRLHQLLRHAPSPQLPTPDPACSSTCSPTSYSAPSWQRLLKALREVQPSTVREFFALATQHMRWELNDLARRLDEQPRLWQRSTDCCPRHPTATPA